MARAIVNCIHVYGSRLGCQMVELNVQVDQIHLLVNVPLKVSISALVGTVTIECVLTGPNPIPSRVYHLARPR